AFVATMAWIALATCNLPALGTLQPRYSPLHAFVVFFVPVANLFIPHQVFTALWHESQPRPDLPQRRVGFDTSVVLVNVWWMLLIGWWGSLFFISVLQMLFADSVLLASRGFQWAFWAGIYAMGGTFIAVVRGIQRRQDEQWLDPERRRA